MSKLKAARVEIQISDELYPQCPRCDGAKLISAQTRYGHEYLPCPLCHGTGEADRDAALSWIDSVVGDDEEEPA